MHRPRLVALAVVLACAVPAPAGVALAEDGGTATPTATPGGTTTVSSAEETAGTTSTAPTVTPTVTPTPTYWCRTPPKGRTAGVRRWTATGCTPS